MTHEHDGASMRHTRTDAATGSEKKESDSVKTPLTADVLRDIDVLLEEWELTPYGRGLFDRLLAMARQSQGSGEAVAWRDISDAPRDGTLFLACNLDRPSFGVWPMLRRVKHAPDDAGAMKTVDLGAWLILGNIEPDYEEGFEQGPDPVWSIASDDLNRSVRYGWTPLAALSAPPHAEIGATVEEIAEAAFSAGYGDGFVDGHCDGAEIDPPSDEATILRRIDCIARHEGWENHKSGLLSRLSTGGAGRDVLAERRRQVEAEGWTTAHDDGNTDSEMAVAAACYALRSTGRWSYASLINIWPKSWGLRWFKPGKRRRALVKAAALLIAEIERLDRMDRAALSAAGGK